MSESWLPSVLLTSSGRPVLLPGEVECSIISSVDLESEEEHDKNPNLFPPFKSGLLILTTHRILWIAESNGSDLVKTASIALVSIIHVFPPKKSIKSMFSSPRIRIQIDGRITGVGSGSVSTAMMITLVLRGKKTDPDAFFGRLWEAVRARAWESSAASDLREKSGGEGSISGDGSSGRGGLRMAGVSGILRKEQELWESTDRSLQEAFQDLNALMSKAKEMVMLAEKMRLKLLSGTNAQSGAANDDEMGSKQEMQDWLLSVGIASPVTKETAGALYHQQLSRQLADFVKLPLEKNGGMIALIDVYCLFNRARGTELISPEDLLQACAIWEKFDVPVMLRKFDSGVMVIQSKAHSDDEVFARIKALVLKPDALRVGISPSDAAMTLGIAPALAKEHLLAAESKGLLSRDISPEGFRFYINLFKEIDPDNIYKVKDHGLLGTWVSVLSSSG